MTAPVLLDFESRSRADLATCGGRRYWEHPSSEALVAVWYDTATGVVGAWTPASAWPHPGRTLAAHNAHGFDRHAAERYGFAAGGWIDTSQLARKAGLPGALDALGERWAGVRKDAEASRFTRSLSSVRRPARGEEAISAAAWRELDADAKRERGALPVLDAAGFERVVRYCASDVRIMAETWPRLAQWLDVDADVERVDRVLNDRGVAFDSDLARVLLEQDARCADTAVRLAAGQLGMTPEACAAAARSPAQFCALAGTPDAQADTVATCAHPLARARQALASIASGKLAAGLARVHADGRLRDTLRYYGAHTGRWSGQGMQLQNLPRPARRFADLPADSAIPWTLDKEGKRHVDVDAYADAALAGAELEADAVALLVRATICASPGNALAVCDYSSVEARATAWAAGDSDAVDVYLSGRDPYKVAASAIFGTPYDQVAGFQRQVGKVSELSAGYGGGPNAFAKMARTYKLDLAGLDTRGIVDAWRALHRPIVSLWYACERAFRAAANGKRAWAGPFEFVHANADDAIACFLPSGRPIVYHEPRIADRDMRYRGTRSEEHVYGGKLVENAIQAFCRDLLADALVRVERAGLNPVLTIHDEIVCDVPAGAVAEAYDELHRAMVTLPPWAAGFPVGADGWTGRRYRK